MSFTGFTVMISNQSLIAYASTYNNFKLGDEMNQKTQVKRYLESGKKITSLDAREKLGILDLPKRMSELREMRFEFKDRWKRVKTRFGGYTRVKEYYL